MAATTLAPVPLAEGAVLVRLPVQDRSWAARLPVVPDGRLVTVAIGHPSLVPSRPTEPRTRGYRIVGIATERAPIGRSIDILVPASLRAGHPTWWHELARGAQRIFDLRMGPVQAVLASQLALHEAATPDPR